ncbi:MAG: hypothetical protein K2P01_07370 [Oscillospiraceae bacterium]|nr:hypothetical protein [Oscillospiraceae bacterium]
MYKKQMTAQKFICLAAVITSAIFFLYSLGIMTDLYDSLYDTMRNPSNPFQTDVSGSIVYYNMQEFNRMFLVYSIVQILLGAVLFITNTHSRRRYYIGNYAAIGLFVAGGVYNAVFAHTYIEIFKAQFLQVDFAALKEHAEMWGTLYTESTFWFDLHYGVFGLLLAVCALLAANAVWKARLMKGEAKLVEEGRRSAG